jgi:ABC-type transport system involved in multi-copper enzyme maturation permease subunit
LIAGVTAIGGSVVVASASASGSKTPFDPLGSVFVAWLEYPVFALGILGVLAFTSEYSTGIIRTTFTAVPQRRTVLAAKFAVVGTVTLVFGEFLAFASFLFSEWVRGSRGQGISLFHANVLGAVVAAGFSLFVITMVGLGIGAVTRHTAGAIAVLPALIYLPLVVLSLPSPWNDRIGSFTILMAAYQTVSLHPQPNLLSPNLSMLVLTAWAFFPLIVAAVVITRRDV